MGNQVGTLSDRMATAGTNIRQMGTQWTMFATGPILAAGGAMVKFAADAQTAGRRLETTFGTETANIRDYLEDLQRIAPASMASLENAASDAMGALSTLGIEQGISNEMTQEALDVTANLSAHMGRDFNETLGAVTSGYAGNTQALRDMAYNINQAAIDTKAFELGLIAEGEAADGAARAQAVHAIVLEQSAGIMDAAENQADTFNYQMRRMWASVQDAGAAIGAKLLPFITPLISGFAGLVEKIQDVNPVFIGIGVAIAGVVAAIGPLLLITGTLMTALAPLAPVLAAIAAPALGVAAAFGVLAAALAFDFMGIRSGLVEVGTILVNLGRYLGFAATEGDHLNDWITHLPEVMRGPVRHIGHFVAGLRHIWDILRALVTGDINPWVPLETSLKRMPDYMQPFGEALLWVRDHIGSVRDVGVAAFDLIGGAVGVMVDRVRSGFGVMRDTFLTFFQALTGGWEDDEDILPIHRIVGNLGNVMAEMVDTISGPLGAVWEGISSGAGAVVDTLSNLWDGATALVDVFNALRTGELGPLTDALGNLPGWLEPVGTAMTEIYDAVSTVVSAFRDDGFIAGLGTIVDVMPDVLTALGDLAVAIGQGVWDAVSGVDWLGLGEDILTGIADAITAAASTVADAATIVYDWIAGPIEQIEWGELASTIWHGITTAFEAVIATVAGAGLLIYDWVSRAVEWVEFGEIGSAIWGGITAAFGAAVTAVGDAASTVYGWISSGVDAITSVEWGQIAGTIWGGIADAVTGAALAVVGVTQMFYDWISTAVSGVDWGGIASSIWGSIAGAAVTAATATADLATALYQWVEGGISGIAWSDLTEQMKTNVQEVWDAAVGGVDAAWEWVSEGVSGVDWEAIELSISTGLATAWGGVLTGLDTFDQWLRDAVDAVPWDQIGADLNTGLQTSWEAVEGSTEQFDRWLRESIGAPESGPAFSGVDWAGLGADLSESLSSIWDHVVAPLDAFDAWLRDSIGAPETGAVLSEDYFLKILNMIENVDWNELGNRLGGWIAEMVPVALGATYGVLDAFNTWLGDLFSGDESTEQEAGDSFGVMLGKALVYGIVGTGNLIFVVGNAFNEFFIGLFQGLTEPMIDWGKGVLDDWYEGFQGRIAELDAQNEALKSAVVGWFVDLKDDVLGAVDDLIGGVVGFFQDLYDRVVGGSLVPDLVTAVVGYFTTLRDDLFGIAEGIKDEVVGFFQDIYDGVTGFAGDLRDDVRGIWESIYSTAEELWNDIYTYVTTTAGDLRDDVVSVTEDARDLIGDAWTATLEFAQETWDTIYSTLSRIAGDVRDEVVSIIEDARDLIGDAWTATLEFAEGIWDDIYTTVTRIAGTVRDEVVDIIETARDLMNTAWDTAYDHATDVWDTLKTYVENGYDAMVAALRAPFDFFRGVVGGIMSAAASFALGPLEGIVNGLRSLGSSLESALNWIGTTLGVGALENLSFPGLDSINTNVQDPSGGGGGPLRMAHGGIIDEPIEGHGLWSGRTYNMGEGGDREAVIPLENDLDPRVLRSIVRGMDPIDNPGNASDDDIEALEDMPAIGAFPFGDQLRNQWDNVKEGASSVADFMADLPSRAMDWLGNGADWVLGQVLERYPMAASWGGMLAPAGGNMIQMVKDGLLNQIQDALGLLEEAQAEEQAEQAAYDVAGGSYSGGLAGWVRPLVGYVTQLFGQRALAGYGPMGHTGVDIAAPIGSPIRAANNGLVYATGWMGGYGNAVRIVHNGLSTLYAHMSQIIARSGQRVSGGDVIGLVGSTGYSTGPHLHLEVLQGGYPINPQGIVPFHNGGRIPEDVMGVGESGRQYSFLGGESVLPRGVGGYSDEQKARLRGDLACPAGTILAEDGSCVNANFYDDVDLTPVVRTRSAADTASFLGVGGNPVGGGLAVGGYAVGGDTETDLEAENPTLADAGTRAIFDTLKAALDLARSMAVGSARMPSTNLISDLKFWAEHAVTSLGDTVAYIDSVRGEDFVGRTEEGASAMGAVFSGLQAALDFGRSLGGGIRLPDQSFTSDLKFYAEHAVLSIGDTIAYLDQVRDEEFLARAEEGASAITAVFSALTSTLTFAGAASEMPRPDTDRGFIATLKFYAEHALTSIGDTIAYLDSVRQAGFIERAEAGASAISAVFGALTSALDFSRHAAEGPVAVVSRDVVADLKFAAEHALTSIGDTIAYLDQMRHAGFVERAEAGSTAITAVFGALTSGLNFGSSVADAGEYTISKRLVSELKFFAEHALASIGDTIAYLDHVRSAGFVERAGEGSAAISSVMGALTSAFDFAQHTEGMRPSYISYAAVSELAAFAGQSVIKLGDVIRWIDSIKADGFIERAGEGASAIGSVMGSLTSAFSFAQHTEGMRPSYISYAALSELAAFAGQAVIRIGDTIRWIDSIKTEGFVERAGEGAAAVGSVMSALTAAFDFAQHTQGMRPTYISYQELSNLRDFAGQAVIRMGDVIRWIDTIRTEGFIERAAEGASAVGAVMSALTAAFDFAQHTQGLRPTYMRYQEISNLRDFAGQAIIRMGDVIRWIDTIRDEGFIERAAAGASAVGSVMGALTAAFNFAQHTEGMTPPNVSFNILRQLSALAQQATQLIGDAVRSLERFREEDYLARAGAGAGSMASAIGALSTAFDFAQHTQGEMPAYVHWNVLNRLSNLGQQATQLVGDAIRSLERFRNEDYLARAQAGSGAISAVMGALTAAFNFAQHTGGVLPALLTQSALRQLSTFAEYATLRMGDAIRAVERIRDEGFLDRATAGSAAVGSVMQALTSTFDFARHTLGASSTFMSNVVLTRLAEFAGLTVTRLGDAIRQVERLRDEGFVQRAQEGAGSVTAVIGALRAAFDFAGHTGAARITPMSNVAITELADFGVNAVTRLGDAIRQIDVFRDEDFVGRAQEGAGAVQTVMAAFGSVFQFIQDLDPLLSIPKYSVLRNLAIFAQEAVVTIGDAVERIHDLRREGYLDRLNAAGPAIQAAFGSLGAALTFAGMATQAMRDDVDILDAGSLVEGITGFIETAITEFDRAAQMMGGPVLESAQRFAEAAGPVLDVANSAINAVGGIVSMQQILPRDQDLFVGNIAAMAVMFRRAADHIDQINNNAGDLEPKLRPIVDAAESVVSMSGQLTAGGEGSVAANIAVEVYLNSRLMGAELAPHIVDEIRLRTGI